MHVSTPRINELLNEEIVGGGGELININEYQTLKTFPCPSSILLTVLDLQRLELQLKKMF